MQISRHWRMNSLRYRLEGVRYQTGALSLQNRPVINDEKSDTSPEDRKDSKAAPTVIYAA
jgi:hypothetical protein